jgi:hypothetical protein
MATNIVPAGMLPLPVQQVAATQRLGAFVKAYKASLVRTIVGTLVFLQGQRSFVRVASFRLISR